MAHTCRDDGQDSEGPLRQAPEVGHSVRPVGNGGFLSPADGSLGRQPKGVSRKMRVRPNARNPPNSDGYSTPTRGCCRESPSPSSLPRPQTLCPVRAGVDRLVPSRGGDPVREFFLTDVCRWHYRSMSDYVSVNRANWNSRVPHRSGRRTGSNCSALIRAIFSCRPRSTSLGSETSTASMSYIFSARHRHRHAVLARLGARSVTGSISRRLRSKKRPAWPVSAAPQSTMWRARCTEPSTHSVPAGSTWSTRGWSVVLAAGH